MPVALARTSSLPAGLSVVRVLGLAGVSFSPLSDALSCGETGPKAPSAPCTSWDSLADYCTAYGLHYYPVSESHSPWKNTMLLFG